MAKAFISSEMLNWALRRSGLSAENVAEKIGTSESRVASWLNGEEFPSFKQAQKFAKSLQIPFGYLYLPEPPKEQIPVTEFRRLAGGARKISRDIIDLLSDIEFKRDWYRDYRIDEGFEKLEFVGRYDLDVSAVLAANDIRSELSRSSNSLFSTRKSYERFLDEFIKAAERIGIWVMRSGVIGNNTHRTISVEELRGFAIADPLVPLIFLNGRDSKSAQIFTFAHELAHIWLGKSSLDSGTLSQITPAGDEAVESKCNAIAAEVLVPSDSFAQQWDAKLSLYDQATRLAEHFSVSRVVIARRALEQKLIDAATYQEFYSVEAARWADLISTTSSGGSYYHAIPARNGRTFTKAVTREAAVGRLLFREAGQLLGVQPSKVRELYERSTA